MLRCDGCETDYPPCCVSEENDDDWCPSCGTPLYPVDIGEPWDEPTPGKTLRAPPAAVARFAALSA